MSRRVFLKKFNEVFLHVSGEASALREIREYFTFEMQASSYHPKVRAKRWDGKIRLLGMNGLIYFGLRQKIIDLCIERGYDVVLHETADETEQAITLIDLKKYIKKLNLPFQVREYQLDAILNILRRGRSLTVSPTGSGKSLIMYIVIRCYIDMGMTGCLIVPTMGLVEQMYKDFKDYSKNNGWNVDEFVQRLYSGFNPEMNTNLLITTWQSLINQDVDYSAQFKFMIGDECHQWEAKSFAKIGKRFTHARYRAGFTGTLKDSKAHEMTLEGMFGPIFYAEKTTSLIKQGYLAETHIKCILFKHSPEVAKAFHMLSYQDEIEYITQNEKRNDFIAKLAVSLKGNTLVMFNYVQNQGLVLYEKILKLAPGRVHLIHGEVHIDQREDIRNILNTRTNDILLASGGTFAVGQNVPNLHNGIWAHPTKSKIRNLQSIGRGLRLGDQKSSFVLYDIADDLTYNNKKNYTLNHFIERLRIYDAEEFDYKIYKLDFKD